MGGSYRGTATIQPRHTAERLQKERHLALYGRRNRKGGYICLKKKKKRFQNKKNKKKVVGKKRILFFFFERGVKVVCQRHFPRLRQLAPISGIGALNSRHSWGDRAGCGLPKHCQPSQTARQQHLQDHSSIAKREMRREGKKHKNIKITTLVKDEKAFSRS